MKNDYYTYAYLRKDGTPYYIGKGRRDRAFSKQGRSLHLPPRDRILFLKKGLTEEEAFKHEIYLIAVFGRKDLGTGILRNLTDGGEGCSNFSEKTLKRMREAQLGKKLPPTQKNKIGESGKKAWERRRQENPESIERMKEKLRGRERSPQTIEKFQESNSRSWRLTFADGVKLEVKNLNKWAKENGYSPGLLSSVSSGKRDFHKDIVSVEKLVR